MVSTIVSNQHIYMSIIAKYTKCLLITVSATFSQFFFNEKHMMVTLIEKCVDRQSKDKDQYKVFVKAVQEFFKRCKERRTKVLKEANN